MRILWEYNKKSGIYKISCSGNGKCYIGSSCNIRKRGLEHLRLLRLGKHHSAHLQRTFTKYGEKTFSHELVIACIPADFPIKEVEYIGFYDKQGLLLNVTRDFMGTRGLIFSAERKAKISASKMGKQAPNKGVPMRKSQRDRLMRIRIKKLSKVVNIYDLNLNLVGSFKGLKRYCRTHKLDPRSLMRVMKGEYANYKGLIYRYADNVNFDPKTLKRLTTIRRLESTKLKIINLLNKSISPNWKDFERNILKRTRRRWLVAFIARNCKLPLGILSDSVPTHNHARDETALGA